MTMHLGKRPRPLQLEMSRGAAFRDTIQLRESEAGPPLPWPDGTSTWIRVFKVGTDFDERFDGVVDTSWLRFAIPAADVDRIPEGATGQVWLEYDGIDYPPFVWREGKVVF
ncbi:LtfC-like domain-containing protein [Rhodococcus koreensis]